MSNDTPTQLTLAIRVRPRRRPALRLDVAIAGPLEPFVFPETPTQRACRELREFVLGERP